jgi:hypothetical protein
MNKTCKTLLAAAALGLAGVTPGGAWAQQQDGEPGQAGKLGTAATGGAPGATAGGGTQGGPAPDKAAPGGGTTAGQGLDAQAAKAGTAATGGAPGRRPRRARGRLPARQAGGAGLDVPSRC